MKSKIGVDTESAEVKYIEIGNVQAMLITKGNEYQLAWATKDNATFIQVVGSGINQEDLIRVAEKLVY